MSYKIKERIGFVWFVTYKDETRAITNSEDLSDLLTWDQIVSLKCGDEVMLKYMSNFNDLPIVTDEVLQEFNKVENAKR